MSLEIFARQSLAQFAIIYGEIFEGKAINPSEIETLMWGRMCAKEAGIVKTGLKIPYDNLKRAKVTLPYMPDNITYTGCCAIKKNGGLYTPCCGKVAEDTYCKSCSVDKEGEAKEIEFGSMEDRDQNVEDGRFAPITFAEWMKGHKTTLPEVYAKLRDAGIALEIPANELVCRELPKRRKGRPAKSDDSVVDEDSVPKTKAKKAKAPAHSEDEAPKPKAKKVKASPAPSEDEAPKPKAKKVKAPEPESESEEEAPKPKAKKVKSPEASEDEEEAPKPKAKKVKSPEASPAPSEDEAPKAKKSPKASPAPSEDEAPKKVKKAEPKAKTPAEDEAPKAKAKKSKEPEPKAKSPAEDDAPKAKAKKSKEPEPKAKKASPAASEDEAPKKAKKAKVPEPEPEPETLEVEEAEEEEFEDQEIEIDDKDYILRNGKFVIDKDDGRIVATVNEDGEPEWVEGEEP